MTNEIQINTSPLGDRDTETENQSPVEGAVWKERYLRLLADLENTKKRLTRTSVQDVEAQKGNVSERPFTRCRWP